MMVVVVIIERHKISSLDGSSDYFLLVCKTAGMVRTI
jgi:hypothetical protein